MSHQDEAPHNSVRGAGRQRILAATRAALLQQGRAGIRVDAIAEAASINKRMIYHYFGDREGLINAALSAELAEVLHSEVSAELKALVRTLFPTLAGSDETSKGSASNALKVLLSDALIHKDKGESKYSLTKSNSRQLAFELVSYLLPDHFAQKSEKPVIRLQGTSHPLMPGKE